MGIKAVRNFIFCQISQIREQGFLLLLKKLISIPFVVVAIPIVLILRILRPWITVRFGCIPSERIGHFAANIEAYLCELDNGRYSSRTRDIFYYNAQISNYQLKTMWDRILRVSFLARFADKANRLLSGGRNYVINIPSDRDALGLFASMPAHLSFSPEEESLGRKGLQELNIPESSPFVCFHARDSGYLDTMLKRKGNWQYHNYRDSEITNYLPAMEMLAERGYHGVRMGVAVAKPINTSNLKIIDYAVRGRSDFLDVYLSAKCEFFLCDTAGIYAVPRIFRRPIAYVNYVPLEYVFCSHPGSLFVPKKLWLKEESRFLTFKEILNSSIGRFLESSKYKKLGIEIIENTPEEIKDLAMEMDQRLKGFWQATEEDEELQKRFWSFFKESELNKVFLARIGAKFLRQNKNLLG